MGSLDEGDVSDGGDDPVLLVDRARAGDAAAWEAIYRRTYPQLLAYASRRLASADDARDAVSEAMARAIASIGRFRGEGAGLDAWLYGILRHVVLDRQRARPTPLQVSSRHPVDPAPEPDERVVIDERRGVVRAAFEQLSPVDQEVLELRVVAGLTADEVARVIGSRPGAVRMAQSRALARLRALVDPEVVGDR